MLLAIRFYPRFKMSSWLVQDIRPRKEGTFRPRDRKLIPKFCETKSPEIIRKKLVQNRLSDGAIDNAYDMVTGDNESPIQKPEFLLGQMPSPSYLNQSLDNLNPLLDTTIPAQERNAQAVESDPINRLADVLFNMQNQPTAQQLTTRPINSNTMTFDGNSEKFERFQLFFTL